MLFACAVASVVAENNDEIDLRPRWTVGQREYIEFTWDNDDTYASSDTSPVGKPFKARIILGFVQRVESITSGVGTTLSLTIDRVALELRTDEEQFACDTDRPSQSKGTPRLCKRIQALIGQSFEVLINDNGVVVSVTGADAVAQRIMPTGDDDPGYAQYLSFPLTDTIQQGIWQRFWGCYAFAEVRVGDKWLRTMPGTKWLPSLGVIYRLTRLDKQDGAPVVIVTYRMHMAEEKEWRTITEDLRSKSGPIEMEGQAVIDLRLLRITNRTEKCDQQTQSRGTKNGSFPQWWSRIESKAKHRIIVTSMEERKASRTSQAEPRPAKEAEPADKDDER